jgi:hypothetical protein
MSDDKTNRGPRDRERVNVGEDYEVSYWTREFNCTEAKLRQAVQAVGPMARDVKAWLAKH